MAEQTFLELAAEEQKEILQTVSPQLARSASVLEKDIWVCWALQALFSMPGAHPMAFKGGTSLSKVYGVIDRFSEDVDITLDYRAFEEDFDPFAEGVSRTKTKLFSERLKSYVSDYANHVVAPHIKNELAKLPTADQHTVEVDGGGEKIWITYPSVVEDTDEYIRSQVLIELGGRNVIDPNETHIPYDTEAQVIEFANGTEYGLASSIWSRDTHRAVELARKIEAGTTFINSHTRTSLGDRRMPFGGVKQSGIGRTRTEVGLAEYVEHHAISLNKGVNV